MNEIQDFVESIREDVVVVKSESGSASKVLSKLSGRKTPSLRKRWKIKYSSKEELAKVLTELRDASVLFAGGSSGWPPSAVFCDLRDKGLISGACSEVTWGAKKQAEVRSL